MVSVHCEDDALIERTNEAHRGTYTPQTMHWLRPSEAESRAIASVGSLAREVGIPLYVVHLSSAKGLEAVRKLRNREGILVVETTPHYSLLDDSRLAGSDGPLYVMTPPLRKQDDNRELQEALLAGEIQVVATDHCSFTREQKLASRDCRTIFPGIPEPRSCFPLMHTLAILVEEDEFRTARGPALDCTGESVRTVSEERNLAGWKRCGYRAVRSSLHVATRFTDDPQRCALHAVRGIRRDRQGGTDIPAGRVARMRRCLSR